MFLQFLFSRLLFLVTQPCDGTQVQRPRNIGQKYGHCCLRFIYIFRVTQVLQGDIHLEKRVLHQIIYDQHIFLSASGIEFCHVRYITISPGIRAVGNESLIEVLEVSIWRPRGCGSLRRYTEGDNCLNSSHLSTGEIQTHITIFAATVFVPWTGLNRNWGVFASKTPRAYVALTWYQWQIDGDDR